MPLKQESFAMLDILAQQTWSPYAAGAGIGILVCISFLLSDRPLGISTAYAKVSGLLEKAITPKRAENEFYRETVPRVDWILMILPGVIIGAFLSAILSGQFHLVWCPVGGRQHLVQMQRSVFLLRLSGGSSLPLVHGGQTAVRPATASAAPASSRSRVSCLLPAFFYRESQRRLCSPVLSGCK